jgi:4-amino-4-deoxy-L-arabinose transferase-like glycosyltransferase
MKMRKINKVLLLILVIAAFLRFWRISEVPVSLFGDELDVGYHAYSILKTGRDYSGNFMPLNFHSLAEWRTPFYLYSTVPTVAIWGISPLGVRFPAEVFGVLGVLGLYLLIKQLTKKEVLALTAALVLAVSPWHIQYSRAAFEVTELLAFYLFGLYYFFISIKDQKYLWLSMLFLLITPLIYSTAKLFTLLLLLVLAAFWWKSFLKIEKKYLIRTVITLLLVGFIVSYATLFAGGDQRFSYISVFSNPVIEPEVGTARLRDAQMRGETGMGISPSVSDKFYHNKFAFWYENISQNLLQPFSTDFLFINGDRNLRHSISGMGQFYIIEIVSLVLGTILFFTGFKDKKIKAFIAFWILLGVVPAAMTRDGGNHATRLIIILPPLIFLISYGIIEGIMLIKDRLLRKYTLLSYVFVWILMFLSYQHIYWVHNPWDSERWWHAGFKDVMQSVEQIQNDYDRVFMSMKGEPVWIFFAGWSEYPPDEWHKGYPFDTTLVDGFGKISFIDKYYFASPVDTVGIYGLKDYLTKKDLYLANASEVGENLIREPARTPQGLKLVKAVAYPSGEPAFYLFTKD